MDVVYTTKELLKNGETEYSIRMKLNSGLLTRLERGVYAASQDHVIYDEELLCKKYPKAVITGLSAFYLYDLTDHIPDFYYLATEQHSYPIRRKEVKQSYQDASFFNVGIVEKKVGGVMVRIYDLERLFIELLRLKEKYPSDVYYEVLNSFRNIKDSIDFYKLSQYLRKFPNQDSLIEKTMEVI